MVHRNPHQERILCRAFIPKLEVSEIPKGLSVCEGIRAISNQEVWDASVMPEQSFPSVDPDSNAQKLRVSQEGKETLLPERILDAKQCVETLLSTSVVGRRKRPASPMQNLMDEAACELWASSMDHECTACSFKRTRSASERGFD